jgi:hypothetical protein
MSPAERIVEIGEILAAGLMRVRTPKSTPKSALEGDSFVDFMPAESGHAPEYGAPR